MAENSFISVAYNHKIKEAVDYIYSLTHERTLDMGIRRFGKTNILADAGWALIELGFISDINGNRAYPKYSWVNKDIVPNDELYISVKDKMQERNRRERLKTLRNKIPFEKSAEVNMSLADFTDKELWDELKARGYGISNNKLVKTIEVTL